MKKKKNIVLDVFSIHDNTLTYFCIVLLRDQYGWKPILPLVAPPSPPPSRPTHNSSQKDRLSLDDWEVVYDPQLHTIVGRLNCEVMWSILYETFILYVRNNKKSEKNVYKDKKSRGGFVFMDVFPRTFCLHGCFDTVDVLSPWTFCHNGGIVATNVLSPDVLSHRRCVTDVCHQTFHLWIKYLQTYLHIVPVCTWTLESPLQGLFGTLDPLRSPRPPPLGRCPSCSSTFRAWRRQRWVGCSCMGWARWPWSRPAWPAST